MNTFWSLKTVTGCSQTRWYEKKEDKTFISNEKIAVLQIFFWRLPNYYKIDLISFTIIVRRPRGPSWNVSWGLLCSVTREEEEKEEEEEEENQFFHHWNISLFFSNYSVFNNLSGLPEKIFLIAPRLLD